MKNKFLICMVILALPTLAMATDLAELFPRSFGEMERVQLLTGTEAQDAVDKLHGKALPAEASAVARYAGPGPSSRPNEVWVSRVSSPTEARRQTGEMVHKMFDNPRSPFKNPKRLQHDSLAIYRFTGMGQTHLIWFKDDLVYWISANPEHESMMMEEFCK